MGVNEYDESNQKGDVPAAGLACRTSPVQSRVSEIETPGGPEPLRRDGSPGGVRPAGRFGTGVPHLDALLGEGQAGGEVHLMVGPHYAGGSHHAVQVAIGGAGRLHAAHLAGGPMKAAYLASYQIPHEELGHRVFSCGAAVSWTRLLQGIAPGAERPCSTRGALLPYGEEMYRRRGESRLDDLPGEEERIREFTAGPGRALQALEMTGRGDGRWHRCGGVGELASHF
ncbi:hypothetical protein [Paludisphaera soli]|uniref:hypothetical protein n=1 Tax=Paludisphaera soli TaxID=2712865 RepID=UPI0013EB61A6|nr:hypothetical protein [Paludisphaera soli]